MTHMGHIYIYIYTHTYLYTSLSIHIYIYLYIHITEADISWWPTIRCKSSDLYPPLRDPDPAFGRCVSHTVHSPSFLVHWALE